jgi:hypothetical protein
MRALVAAALVLALAAGVAAPHVHPHWVHDECGVCVLRNADAPDSDVPDVAPVVRTEGDAPRAPDLPPVTGAPLGAVPGQSPPAGA